MIIDYIVSHQSEFWIVIGFACLAIEVLTGFSTGMFLFAGLGALITGALMGFGILPETWIAGLSSTGISTGIVTAALWQPLKKLQGDGSKAAKDNSSDLVGFEFATKTDITKKEPGSVEYSGLNWRVEIDPQIAIEQIAAGSRVVVTSVEVGLFKVRPL